MSGAVGLLPSAHGETMASVHGCKQHPRATPTPPQANYMEPGTRKAKTSKATLNNLDIPNWDTRATLSCMTYRDLSSPEAHGRFMYLYCISYVQC